MDETLNKIENLIATAEKFRSSYFWKAPTSASARRSYEKRYSIPALRWEEGGHSYAASFGVSCSAQNVYAKGEYYRDGKKTTLTTIRNSLRRMVDANLISAYERGQAK